MLYWLASGVRLFGEHLLLLKLWLFPFPLILAYATRYLLFRFARGVDKPLTLAILLGPGVLPFLNMMLDVPALALYIAAVTLLLRANERRTSKWLVIAAGICTALAVQTKYAVLVAPVVLLWRGFCQRRLIEAIIAVAIGALLFIVWEMYLIRTYGTSHFVYHVIDQAAAVTPRADHSNLWQKLIAVVSEKNTFIVPLIGYFGVTAWWLGPVAWNLLGTQPQFVRWAVVISLALLCALVLTPGQWTGLISGPYPTADRLTLNEVLFVCSGFTALLGGMFTAFVLVRKRASPATWFLLGWFLIEVAGCYALTPFPAGRRVLGVSFILALLVGHLWSRFRRIPRRRVVLRWLPTTAAMSGLALAAIDTLDAYPEKVIPNDIVRIVQERGWMGTGWYVGHWGFQYYCDRLGMKPLLPGRSELQPDDWIAFPLAPDENPFFRPYNGRVRFEWDNTAVVRDVELVWLDPLSAQTIPNLYGGKVPILSRKYPRLRVAVYRVVRPWRPIAAPPA
jgi:4-amino-4-deoxy-L-arabinose transferase-like glycosyltransferase